MNAMIALRDQSKYEFLDTVFKFSSATAMSKAIRRKRR